ncbi:MAG: prepilin-type N-terminal cleavage/methylation domain-containing protein [Lysobacterales bacterium]
MFLVKKYRGFTMAELLVVVMIAGILASIAVPGYSQYRDRIDNTTALADIQEIELAIERFWARRGRFPETLEDVNMHTKLDPWGNPYQYLNIANTSEKDQRRGHTGKGRDKQNMRRDRNLKPINSDFDLFSAGKDGDFKPQLNAKASRDDIIRASDGQYVGLAEDY